MGTPDRDKDATSLGALKPTMSPDLIVQVEPGMPAKEMSYQEAIREALPGLPPSAREFVSAALAELDRP